MKFSKIKIIAAVILLSLPLLFLYYKTVNDLSFLDLAKNLFVLLSATSFGWLIYVVISTLRPFIFFPMTIISAIAGILFGFWWGFAAVVVGENIAVNLLYFLGKYFGADFVEKKDGFLKKWKKALRENSFETILIIRFSHIGFVSSSFLAGALKIKWKEYFLASFIGSLPWSAVFVSIGASVGNIESFDPSKMTLDTNQLIITGAMAIVSFAVARFIKKRKKNTLQKNY